MGLCGGLDPALRPDQVVVADRVLSLEPREEYPARWPGCTASGTVCGGVLTVDRFVERPEERRDLRSTGAVAVEMEAAGVAAEALKRELPFFCIRAVSDGAEMTFRIDYNRARLSNGRFSEVRVAREAGLSPACWKEVIWLWRRARSAAEALGDFFASFRFQI